MRAVLRATFAARRRARPTAAENSLLLSGLYLRFIEIAPRIVDSYPNYHTRSTCRLKARSASRSWSNSDRIGAAVSAWNIVAALPDAYRDASQSKLRRMQAQVNNLDAITGGFPALQAAKIRETAQRALEREVRACSGKAIEFLQKQASSRKRGQFRPQRRKAAGDQIGVHEANDPSVFR